MLNFRNNFITEPKITPSNSSRDELDSDMSSSFGGSPNHKIGEDVIKREHITHSKGFSIIETLISVGLFAILATITTQSLASSLRSSRKSQSLGEVRENVDYSISTMERLLRNAQDLDCSGPQPNKRLNYIDEYGNNVYFECSAGFIASNSASVRLTSRDVLVTDCGSVFRCTDGAGGVPDSVEISLSAQDADYAGTTEGATITSSTRLLLRVYK